MIISALKKLVKKENLTAVEMKNAMEEILTPHASEAAVSAFLTSLRMKGETIEEITAAAELLRLKAEKLTLEGEILDIVGTGGDGADTFNISTGSAFILAAGGVKIAKHGNRASSSKSGSADVLEALGANILTGAAENRKIFEKTGICFMFAQKYNSVVKNAAKVRKEIGIRTIFNILGPLINPSNVSLQIIGVYEKNLVEPMANAMKNLGIKRGMALYGEPGLDEASTVSITYFAEIKENKITKGEFKPSDFGIKEAKLTDIKGGSAIENAEILKNIFLNRDKGAKKDILALNSALGFYAAGKTKTVKEGVLLANSLIETGIVYEKLNEFIKAANEYT